MLGAGAMGAVYAAHDPELDRPVALKVLHADPLGDPAERRSRLAFEAQAMARLAHPNVVAVFDVGVDAPTGQLFVAMEHVSGATLAAWLRAAPRSESAVLDVFLQAGRGLAAAHAAGLVHRDFKPENVLVGADGRARVGDFGLARRPHGAPALPPGAQLGGLALTAQGALVGTPAYMSPEQLRGTTADARSDQFAFAVALFEALTGTRPFAGQSLGELAGNVVGGRVSPALANRPTWQRAFFQRALATDPGSRYASMEAALEDLGRDRRTPRRTIAIAVASVLTVAGVVAAVVLSTGRGPAAQRANGTAAASHVNRAPSGVDPPSDAVKDEVDAIRDGLEDLEPELWNWDLGPAKAKLDALVARARATAYEPVVAECFERLARIESHMERPKQAKEALEEAVRIARASRHDELLYDATIDLVRLVGVDLGDAKECETWIGFAESEAKRHPDDRARRAALDLAIGEVRRKTGKLDDARAHVDAAVTARESVLGAESIEVAEARALRAEIALARSDFGEAEQDARLAHDAAAATVVVRNGPQMLRYKLVLGEALLAKGDLDAASAMLDGAVAMASEVAQDRSPIALGTYDARARCAIAQGDAARATELADRAAMGMLTAGADGKLAFVDPTGMQRTSGGIDFAAKIRSKVEKVDDPYHVSEENALACARAVEGDERGAIAAITKALEHADQNPATVGGSLGALHYNRGLLLVRAGDLAAAGAAIDLARAYVEREVGTRHVRFGLVELLRARLLKRLGSADAQAVRDSAVGILAARRGGEDAWVRAARAD